MFQFVFPPLVCQKRNVREKWDREQNLQGNMRGNWGTAQICLADSCAKLEEEVMGMPSCWGVLTCRKFWVEWVVMCSVCFEGGTCKKVGLELLCAENWSRSLCWCRSSQGSSAAAGKEGADGDISQGLNTAQSKWLLFVSFNLSDVLSASQLWRLCSFASTSIKPEY